jgi:PPOX class probable F420-dependent enzyme
MTSGEIEELLACHVPAHLATLDAHGFPHITPLWFIWAEDAFYMTSITDRPHLRRLARDPRAGICVDIELAEREDGQRPNRQVRAVGNADLMPDTDGIWTRRITEKYVYGPTAAERITMRTADKRTAIRLRPERIVAVAST